MCERISRIFRVVCNVFPLYGPCECVAAPLLFEAARWARWGPPRALVKERKEEKTQCLSKGHGCN